MSFLKVFDMFVVIVLDGVVGGRRTGECMVVKCGSCAPWEWRFIFENGAILVVSTEVKLYLFVIELVIVCD